jgi:CubicO group peptidase (beta-lactamase class C family)
MLLKRAHQEMNRGIMERIFPGALLLVTRQGEAIFNEPYGKLGGPQTAAVTHDTLFDLASLTKVLATTPIWMILASRNPEILDQPLIRWFPNCDSDEAAITPRLLLAHSSGLPAWRPYYLFASSTDSMKGLVQEKILSETLEYDPGQGCLYSDLGFMLLAFIAEQETGQALEVVAKQMVFQPLGLAEHLVFRPNREEGNIAATRPGEPAGLVNDLNARSLGSVAGHAGLFGTAYAVARLATECLTSLKKSNGMFSPEITRVFCTRTQYAPGSTRALGFDTPSPEGPSCGSHFPETSLGHAGFTGTSLWIDPERELIVVLLTNRVFMGEADFRIKTFRPILHDAVMEDLEGE